MKKFFKTIILLFAFSSTFAQKQIKVEYRELEFGKIIPCILYVKGAESIYIQNPQWKNTQKEEISIGGQNGVPQKGVLVKQQKSTTLIKDLAGKKIYKEIFNSDYHYYMEDELPDYAWQITKESKKIGNYNCTKATSKKYRGRVWEVWFTTEIPVKEGPWKFRGLPGLILEAQDDGGTCIIQVQKIELNSKETINFQKDSKLDIKTFEESRKLSEERSKKIEKKLKAMGLKEVEGSRTVQQGREIL